MGKTLVNKHTNTNEILEIAKMFHKDEDGNLSSYARGEIVVFNGNEDENEPSIYAIGHDGNPHRIATKLTSSDGTAMDADALKLAIAKEYKAADDIVKVSLQTEIQGAKTELQNDYDNKFVSVYDKIDEKEESLKGVIGEAKANVLSYTINNKSLGDNPVLIAEDIKIEKVTEPTLFNINELISGQDDLRDALKKLENMILANALATSAALTNLHNRIDELEKNHK